MRFKHLIISVSILSFCHVAFGQEKRFIPLTPTECDYTTESIIASGQRGGDLLACGTNFTYSDNKAMGLAMELWNAHQWDESASLLKGIYQQNPESSWAAEAEMHMGCFNFFSGNYDEAEDCFLSVLEKHGKHALLVKKVLHYLPQLYAESGRVNAAMDSLEYLANLDLTWEERQHVQNWQRRLSGLRLEQANGMRCGTKALSVVKYCIDHPEADSLRNVSLRSILLYSPFAVKVSDNPLGYSIQDLCSFGNGIATEWSYDELCKYASLTSPILVYCDPPSEAALYTRFPPCLRATNSIQESGHFVVVRKADSQSIEYLDPDQGIKRITSHAFQYRWKGIVLLFGDQIMNNAHPFIHNEKLSELRGGCCGFPPPALVNGVSPAVYTGPVAPNTPGSPVNGPVQPQSAACPSYMFGLANCNLLLIDTPIALPPCIGPNPALQLCYNRIETEKLSSSSNLNYRVFGNKWSFNYGAYITEMPSDSAILVTRGDGEIVSFENCPGYPAHNPQIRDTLSCSNNYYYFHSARDNMTYCFYSNTLNFQLLASIQDRYGNELSLTYNGQGQLCQIQDAVSRSFTFTYDTNGCVERVTDDIGRYCRFEYENGDLILIQDKAGYITTMEYDSEHWLTGLYYPNAAFYTFDYATGDELPLPYSDPRYERDGYPAFRIQVTDQDNHVQEYFYHAVQPEGPATVRDRCGNEWCYAFEPYLDIAPVYQVSVNAKPGTVNFGEDMEGYVGGTQWKQRSYNGYGNLVQEDFALNVYTSQHWAYWGFFTPPYETNDLTLIYTYDSNNWVSGMSCFISNQFYAAQSNQYDSRGNLTWNQDVLGGEWHMTYNDTDDLSTMTNPLDQSVRMNYNPDGCMTQLVDVLTNEWTILYNALSLPVLMTSPDGSSNTWIYDNIGRLTGITSRLGFNVNIERDDTDRPIKFEYPDGTSVEYEYDLNGPSLIRDRMGYETYLSYGTRRQPVQIKDANGNSVNLGYDPEDYLTNISYSVNGKDRCLSYDFMNSNGYTRLKKQTSQNGNSVEYTYTLRGTPATRIDGENQSTTYTSDGFGRIVEVEYGNGTNIQLSYDIADRIIQASSSINTNTFTYNAINSVTNHDVYQSIPGMTSISYSIDYEYDAAGRVVFRELKGISGFTNEVMQSHSWNNINQLNSVSNSLAHVIYSYNLTNRHSNATYGNGDHVLHVFDAEGRLVSILISNNTSEIYNDYLSRNAAGMITQRMSDANTVVYDYNSIYRLQSMTINDTGKTEWVFDDVGNLMLVSGPTTNLWTGSYADDDGLLWHSRESNYLVDVAGQVDPGTSSNKWYNTVASVYSMSTRIDQNNGTFVLTNTPMAPGSNTLLVKMRDVSGNKAENDVTFEKTAPGSQDGLSYDNNGNLIEWIDNQMTNTYRYDMENRLVEAMRDGEVVLECWYDALGRRCAKREVVDGVTNACQYIYDGMSIIGVLDGDGALIEYYTRGTSLGGDVGSLIAVTHFDGSFTTGTFYVHSSWRGDVVAVRSGSDTLAEFSYTAYGQLDEVSGTYTSRFLFSSKERDTATGWYNFGFRYYDPDTRRFITMDPLGVVAGLNQYILCSGNPICWIDPWGLCEGKAWNPSGHAKVYKGSKIGIYIMFGAEFGTVTLEFDNGYAQDYQYAGGGIGFGGPGGSVDFGGHVYGVYETSDYTGPFINVEGGFLGGGAMSYWGFGENAVSGFSGGGTTPGISAAYQGYWKVGSPYRIESKP